jgi:hypothetical protein
MFATMNGDTVRAIEEGAGPAVIHNQPVDDCVASRMRALRSVLRCVYAARPSTAPSEVNRLRRRLARSNS